MRFSELSIVVAFLLINLCSDMQHYALCCRGNELPYLKRLKLSALVGLSSEANVKSTLSELRYLLFYCMWHYGTAISNASYHCFAFSE